MVCIDKDYIYELANDYRYSENELIDVDHIRDHTIGIIEAIVSGDRESLLFSLEEICAATGLELPEEVYHA